MIKRYLHTLFRVSDMEESIHFYTRILCMKVLEQKTSRWAV
ncbi:MAG: VOC family protein [Nitrospinaceae bacterium]